MPSKERNVVIPFRAPIYSLGRSCSSGVKSLLGMGSPEFNPQHKRRGLRTLPYLKNASESKKSLDICCSLDLKCPPNASVCRR